MRLPRSSRIAGGGSESRSTPSKRIWPPATRPARGRRPMMDSAVTLLPQPDSPTRPSVPPEASDRLIPSTAANSPPPSTAKLVRRPRISSNALIDRSSMRQRRCPRVKAFDLCLDLRTIGDACRPRPRGQTGHEGLVTFEALDVESKQFGQRLRVIVDAQIEERIGFRGTDQKRGSLLAALVAARGLTRLHCGNQALRERQLARCVIGLNGVLDNFGTGQHITCNRESISGNVPAPLDAFESGVCGDISLGVDDVQLPMITAAVALDQRLDNV